MICGAEMDSILDIGTRRADDRKRQEMTLGGTSSLCPPMMRFGEPGAFDVPSVADVSREVPNYNPLLLQQRLFLNNFCFLNLFFFK